jgi:hypothetical protein
MISLKIILFKLRRSKDKQVSQIKIDLEKADLPEKSWFSEPSNSSNPFLNFNSQNSKFNAECM